MNCSNERINRKTQKANAKKIINEYKCHQLLCVALSALCIRHSARYTWKPPNRNRVNTLAHPSTLHKIHCTQHAFHFTFALCNLHFTLCTQHSAPYTPLPAPQPKLHTLYSTLHSLQGKLQTRHPPHTRQEWIFQEIRWELSPLTCT